MKTTKLDLFSRSFVCHTRCSDDVSGHQCRPLSPTPRAALQCAARVRARSRNLSGEPTSGFLMRMTSPRVAYVDCHSAALLRSRGPRRPVIFFDDPRLVVAIECGLASDSCGPALSLPATRVRSTPSRPAWSIVWGTRRTENAFGILRPHDITLVRRSSRITSSVAAIDRRTVPRANGPIGDCPSEPTREIDHSGRRGYRNPHGRFCRRDQLRNATLGNARVIRPSVGLTYSLGNPCGLSAIL